LRNSSNPYLSELKSEAQHLSGPPWTELSVMRSAEVRGCISFSGRGR
jgi:hypothetical protein